MNRSERRNLKQKGANPETIKNLDAMSSPCTIAETIQLARAVSEDAITEYHQEQGHVRLSMSIQIEVLKDLLLSSGVIKEEEFTAKYQEKIIEVQEYQKKVKEESENTETTMKMNASDIEVNIEK